MAQLGNRSAQWSEMAKFPGGGVDVPNYAVANGSLYMFGGWRASFAGMQAWQESSEMAAMKPKSTEIVTANIIVLVLFADPVRHT